jgi:hypothetical protein
MEENDAQNARLAEERFKVIMPTLSRLNQDGSRDSHFTNVLVGLGMESYHAFGELSTGIAQKIMIRAALGARNLFELKYWIQYAVISQDNVRRLRRDAIIDLRELLDKHAAGLAVATSLKLAPEELKTLHQQGREMFDEKCREQNLSADGRHLNVADISRDLGGEAEYKVVFPFLSKFVHPTGLSICLPELTDNWLENVYSMGCWYFNEAFVRLDGGLKGFNLPSFT